MNLTNYWDRKVTRQVADAEQGSTPAPVPVVAPVPEAAPDLTFIPQDFYADGKPDFAKFTEHYQGLVAADATAKERAALIPEDAAYDISLPDDMKFEGMDLPADYKPNLDLLADPAFQPIAADLKAFLKDAGAPKESGKAVAALIARYEAAKESRRFVAQKEDAKQLGTFEQGKARTEVVGRALLARLPEDQANAVRSMTGNAKALMALETLLSPKGLGNPTPVPTAAVDPLAARYPNTANR